MDKKMGIHEVRTRGKKLFKRVRTTFKLKVKIIMSETAPVIKGTSPGYVRSDNIVELVPLGLLCPPCE